MFNYVYDMEMRVLSETNVNTNANINNNESAPLAPNSTEPLPSTNLINTIDLNGPRCLLAYYFAIFHAGSQDSGQDLVALCTDNPDFVDGLSGNKLILSNCLGTVIAFTLMGAGGAINSCASSSESPVVRLGGMAAADTCITSGKVMVYTPVGSLIGAAALGGEPLSTAALTTSTLAWLAAVPITAVEAWCFHQCFKPEPGKILHATTTRLAQYQSISAKMGETPNRPPPNYSVNQHN